MSVLHKAIVLKLNKAMMPVYYESPMRAFRDMTGAPTPRKKGGDDLPYVALEVGYIPLDKPNTFGYRLLDDINLDPECITYYQTYTWEDWINQPIRTLVNLDTGEEKQDPFVTTSHQKVRVPYEIIAQNYSGTHYKVTRFSKNAVRERDKNICQYTGEYVPNNEGDLEHCIPISRGGQSTFENCVWAAKKVNQLKADMTPDEFRKKHGIKLLKQPAEPPSVPMGVAITNIHRIPEWELFLLRKAHARK